jgi:hypothetical protein
VDFQKALQAFPKDGGDLWLVLIGHGTFEGRSAKFNLRGDDITSTELAAWLEPFHRRVIVWNLFSASGAFLSDLSRDNRVVITATRNGTEGNYSRFGELLAERLTAPDSDLDGDGVTSVLELVVSASSHTQASYENDQRLLSEHAQLDDNGDGVGAESVALLHPSPKSGLVPDGAIAATISLARDDSAPSLTAAQISQRAGIEARIAALRERKAEMNEALYYQKLESLLLEMARLYQHARAESGQ